MLVKKGIKELIIIAQDTTKYGIDIYGENKLEVTAYNESDVSETVRVMFNK